MKYKVKSELTLKDVSDYYEYTFDTKEAALDYYRESFKVMAESIVDFGGDFTHSIYDENGVILQRNTITTTINKMHHE